MAPFIFNALICSRTFGTGFCWGTHGISLAQDQAFDGAAGLEMWHHASVCKLSTCECGRSGALVAEIGAQLCSHTSPAPRGLRQGDPPSGILCRAPFSEQRGLPGLWPPRVVPQPTVSNPQRSPVIAVGTPSLRCHTSLNSTYQTWGAWVAQPAQRLTRFRLRS